MDFGLSSRLEVQPLRRRLLGPAVRGHHDEVVSVLNARERERALLAGLPPDCREEQHGNAREPGTQAPTRGAVDGAVDSSDCLPGHAEERSFDATDEVESG